MCASARQASRARSRSLRIAALASLLVYCFGEASAGRFAESLHRMDDEPRIAVLLFANNTGTMQATEVIMPLVYERLSAEGIDFVPHAEVRPVQRRHRIRSVGMIDSIGAARIGAEVGAGFLLVGSLDLFRTEENPEVSVSARLIEADGIRMIAAAARGATGEDHAGLFGLGRITRIEALAEKVVDGLFEELRAILERGASESAPTGKRPTVAVIPFDDLAGIHHGGSIATSVAIAELLHAGYSVVEPGVLRERFLTRRAMPRGMIDLPTLQDLHRSYGISFALTGVVQAFRLGSGPGAGVVPEVEIGVRLLDARTGRVLLALDETRDGDQSELLLGIGKGHSVTRLLHASMRRFIHEAEGMGGAERNAP